MTAQDPNPNDASSRVPAKDDAGSVSRRAFVQTSAGVLAGATLASLGIPLVHAGGSDIIRVGLVGCGGRGTGAAANALEADPGTKLVAMGDLFADQLERSHRNLTEGEFGSRVDVPESRRFAGVEAYREVMQHCDVVLLCTPPHFRPQHLEAAVKAGIHSFAEKPVAVDATGVRRAMEAYRKGGEQRLSMVSGFCYRYDEPKQELMLRLHDGAIGELRALECVYNAGGLWHRGRQPEWSDFEWQLRNWLYFTWLSGDHITEQSCHSIDKILWAMNDEAPIKVTASGGRSVRTEEKYGNVYDHFGSTFEWKNGVKAFHSCRQWNGADTHVHDYAFGSEGTAAIQHHRISGSNEWRFRGRPDSMYVREHQALMASIRSNQPINDGDYMCKSTLMAVMARMSAYTGKVVTWEQALASNEDLTPANYSFGPLPVAPIAQPGRTPLI